MYKFPNSSNFTVYFSSLLLSKKKKKKKKKEGKINYHLILVAISSLIKIIWKKEKQGKKNK